MKTPREILMEKHQITGPKLDAIRHTVVKELNNKATREQSLLNNLVALFLGCSKNFWQELVLPSRRVWTGLAATWLIILLANFSLRDHSPTATASSSASPQVVMSVAQQEKLLAELSGPDQPVVAEPQKPFVPRPSSLRPFEIITT